LLIGVTGNIGAGKSTFCKFIKLEGFPVYSADEIGKSVLFQVKDEIVSLFGREILKETGEIDTSRLGRVVFSSRKKLELLTNLTHPLIKREILRIRESLSEKVGFLEAAVLIEAGWQEICDRIAVVFAYKGQRILRASKRFGMREALRRDSLQMPYSEKLKYADYLICNVTDLLKLKKQAISLLRELK